MGKFDAELMAYVGKMGFRVEKRSIPHLEKILKSVVYRLVRNIMTNILSVVENTGDDHITVEHVEATSRVCKRCVKNYDKAAAMRGGGGGTVLPLEYFTGVLTPHYSAANGAEFQSTHATADLARQGLSLAHAGGAPMDIRKDPSLIHGYVEHVCLKKFFKGMNIVAYTVSKCALKRIVMAAHENVLIIFDHIYRQHTCGIKRHGAPCLLNLDIAKRVLRSDKFQFLK